MLEVSARLARRARRLAPSPIRELVPLSRLPGMISFGGGYPNPKTFAFANVEVTFKSGTRVTVEGAELDEALQYGATEGHPALRAKLRGWHAHKDQVQLGDDQLVILNGSQEGLFIAAYLLLDPDDTVVIGEPEYPGALSAFRAFCPGVQVVPVDGEGLDTAALAARLGELRAAGTRLPKLVYCVSNGHNPAGVDLSLARRRQLVALAEEFDLLILEDDPYQMLRLEDAPRLPTVQSLAPERVIRLDSFSKIFAPGLRLGYASGPPALMRAFVLFKQAANLHTSSFAQATLAHFFGAVDFAAFTAEIGKCCALYRANRDAMVTAARAHLPEEVTFNIPPAGMFLWLELPERFDAKRMITLDTRTELVLLVPGEAFSTRGGLRNCLRASFSTVEGPEIDEGMRRLARMIEKERQRTG